jgi:shikimate kinase
VFKALPGSPGRAFLRLPANCNPSLRGVYPKDMPGVSTAPGPEGKRAPLARGDSMSNIRIPEQAEPFSLPNLPENSCITFIGMAGAGKTTVGRLVARALDWAFADSDHIIEAAFGAPLQAVTDRMTKDEFIELEADMVCDLRFTRTVISTGGSVIYRQRSMEHLASLGPIVYLDVPLATILERIARNPDREVGVYLLDKKLDEEVARLHLSKMGAKLSTLTQEQADYIGVNVEGPYKNEHYRY